MISSVFTLKDSYVPESLVPVKTTNLVEQSHTISTLDFIKESHKSLLSYKQDFYKSIVESSLDNNEYNINEAFNEVIYNIKNVINKNIDYLDVCVKRFETQLCKYIDSDKYIMKKKDNLKSFPDGASFDTTGYEFTFKDNIPTIDIVGLDLSELKEELKNISDCDIISKLAKLSELLTRLSDQRFDEVCGQILGCDPVTQVDFNNSVFSAYRDGQSEEGVLNIGKEEVLKSVNNYSNYKDMIKQVKTLQNEIINKYKTLESQIDEIIKSNLYLDGNSKLNMGYDTIRSFSDYKSKLSNAIDQLTLSLTNRIQKISTFHLQAFAGKLDAYNSKIMQDRSILYSALNVMNSTNVELTDESAIDFDIDGRSYDYTRDATIYNHMIEMYELDLRQERFVQECLVLMEGNISELKTINEDLKMDKQNVFERIKAFIKRIFEKFTMKLNKLVVNNKDFLKKYENIIKRVKVKDFTINDMPDYKAGIKNITSHEMPHIDIKKNLDKSEEQIQEMLLPAYKGEGEYKDFVKRFFLCDNKKNEEAVQSVDVNMVELYEFCIQAPDKLTKLKADKDFILKETEATQKLVLSVAQGSTTINKPTTTTPEGKTNESVDIIGNNKYYSSVLEMYISEEDAPKDNKEGESVTLTSNETKDGKEKPAENMDLVPARQAKDNKDLDVAQDREKNKEKTDAQQAEENRNADAKKIKETGQWYIKALGDVYSCKITSFQRIYQEYMKILRYHVKLATANMDASTADLTDEDKTDITNAMKDYVKADKEQNKEAKEAAANKIKSVYHGKNIGLDNHDIDDLIKKNRTKIEKLLDAK